MSAEEDLTHSRRVEKEDIGFSSREHIGGELKTAITEVLEEMSLELSTTKKYGK